MEVEDYEKLLKHVYRTAPIGLCFFDTELRFQYINEWLALINGLSVEAHLGRTISEVIPDVSAGVEAILRRVMETGEPVLNGVVEAETQASPHQKRSFQHSYHAIMSDEGSVVGVSCIVQDITSRKRAEDALVEANNQLEESVRSRTEKLKKSELRHRLLLESTRAIPWEVDATTFQFTYVGSQAGGLLGIPPALWLDIGFWSSHIHPEDREFAIDYCLRSMKSKVNFDFEYRMVAADGRTVWIHDIVNVESEAGEPKTLRGFMIDITERELAKKAMEEIATRLQLATDATHIGHWDHDLRTDKVYFSREWKRQLGYEDHELSNRFDIWESRLHPDDLKCTTKAYHDYIAGREENYEIEFRLRHKDGSYRWIYTRGEKLFDDTRKPCRLFGCHVDITERKKAEVLLKDSEARFRMIYEQAPVMIDAYDENGRCVMFNKECEKVFGWTAEEVFALDNPLMAFYPDPEIRRQIMETVTTKPEKVFKEWKQTGKDGSELLCLWANFRLPDGQVINLGYDISEQRYAQDELRRNRDDMRVLARRLNSAYEDERRRIARELHDDLSQRLASIALDVTLVERDMQLDSELWSESLLKISDRIGELSADVQHYSHRLHPSILDELGLIQAIESECTAFRSRTGILVQFTHAIDSNSLEKDLVLTLYRILQECLHNVEKHAQATNIQVNLSQDDQFIQLTVEDSGIGFDPDVMCKKSGLGMVSINERAQLLGGDVTIESEIGRGTIVSIRIPTQGLNS